LMIAVCTGKYSARFLRSASRQIIVKGKKAASHQATVRMLTFRPPGAGERRFPPPMSLRITHYCAGYHRDRIDWASISNPIRPVSLSANSANGSSDFRRRAFSASSCSMRSPKIPITRSESDLALNNSLCFPVRSPEGLGNSCGAGLQRTQCRAQ